TPTTEYYTLSLHDALPILGHLHLTDGARERDHDLRLDADALLGHGARRLHDGADLHAIDLRRRDAEAAAAMAEHRVRLAQRIDRSEEHTSELQSRFDLVCR